MRFEFKDFIVDSEGGDDYILYQKNIRQESRLTKAENVGKEFLTVVGYFRNLDYALNRLGDIIVKQNSDVDVVIEKLNDLEREIREISEKMRLRIRIVE